MRIDALAAGGDGIGRGPDGRVIFTPLTAPGDLVRVRIVRRRARLAHAEVEELLEAGPDRAEPRCDVFGDCGGCAWQHIAYPAQVDAKAQILRDALTRIGGLTLAGTPGITPSPAAYGYRSRARVRASAAGVGFRRRRSHTLCTVDRCPVLADSLEEQLAKLSERSPTHGEWELAEGLEGARATLLGARSAPRLSLEAAGERIGFSPGVFAQANAALLDPLTRALTSAAGEGGLALELYAGAGFLTLGLARRFLKVIAVEASAAAAADLRSNLRDAGIDHVEVREARVEDAMAALERDVSADVVVLDPPRAGVAPPALDALARMGAPRIVYLSCDPATLARDLRVLAGVGYALQHVEAFDLFPQTPHVEALAVLER